MKKKIIKTLKYLHSEINLIWNELEEIKSLLNLQESDKSLQDEINKFKENQKRTAGKKVYKPKDFNDLYNAVKLGIITRMADEEKNEYILKCVEINNGYIQRKIICTNDKVFSKKQFIIRELNSIYFLTWGYEFYCIEVE